MALSIKKHRQHKGWSQSRLARESGVSQTYISELEAGKWTPNLAILQKLAAALGVLVVDFLDEDESGEGEGQAKGRVGRVCGGSAQRG